MNTFFAGLGFLSTALLFATACAPTRSDTSTSGLGDTTRVTRANFGPVDGCGAAPASFKDGVAFARLPSGRVAQGFIIKVINDESNLNFGAAAGYYQASDTSPLPSLVTPADLGEYGKGSVYGYPGVTVTPANAHSLGDIYSADSFENKNAARKWVKDGNAYYLYVDGQKIGEGRELGRQFGKMHVLFWAVNGACFGVAAARDNSSAAKSGAQAVQVDANGGSFLTWLGGSSADQSQKGKQDIKPKFEGSMPSHEQQRPAGTLDPAPTTAPTTAPSSSSDGKPDIEI